MSVCGQSVSVCVSVRQKPHERSGSPQSNDNLHFCRRVVLLTMCPTHCSQCNPTMIREKLISCFYPKRLMLPHVSNNPPLQPGTSQPSRASTTLPNSQPPFGNYSVGASREQPQRHFVSVLVCLAMWAAIFLTPDGVKRGTRIARLMEHERWDRVFSATCVGVSLAIETGSTESGETCFRKLIGEDTSRKQIL